MMEWVDDGEAGNGMPSQPTHQGRAAIYLDSQCGQHEEVRLRLNWNGRVQHTQQTCLSQCVL